MTAVALPAERLVVGRRWWPTPRTAWHWIVFLTVAALVVTPTVFLVLGSFSTAPLPTEFDIALLGLDNYRAVWLDPATYKVFANTLIYVAGATAIGIGIAAVLA